jgi:hypothetical protein
LDGSFRQFQFCIGSKPLNREELHERSGIKKMVIVQADEDQACVQSLVFSFPAEASSVMATLTRLTFPHRFMAQSFVSRRPVP